MNRYVLITVVLLSGLTAGCAKKLRPPELAGIYQRAAMHVDAMRNPVVVIPGILGSRLIDSSTGQVVWGAFGGGAVNASRPAGARLVSLPMGQGVSLNELVDSVRPEGVLARARLQLIGLPVELNAYVDILETLGAGGYRDELLGKSGAIDYGDAHFTCFQFDYDWRRDNVENAQRLHQFLLEKRAYVQAERARRFGVTDSPVKFDLVAHSMGGLVARYYLRYGAADLPAGNEAPTVTWAGAELVDRAILIGTPNAGSVKALLQLLYGADFAPILPRYEAVVIGSMPSVYQLLPRPRHGVVVQDESGRAQPVDFFDPAVWQRMGWGLADPKAGRWLEKVLVDEPDARRRTEIARDHLQKCLVRARQFAAALDSPVHPPPGLELYLFAGDAVSTASRITFAEHGGILRIDHAPGDGTVTRASALMDERLGAQWTRELKSPIHWSQVVFLFKDHLGLTKDPAFSDNVLYILLESR